VSAAIIVVASVGGVVLGSPSASQSAEARAVAQRFNDGLDSRHSASSLVSAAKAVGYTGTAKTSGTSADAAWVDAAGSQVIGYFGHANAGVFQVDEGSTNETDQFIAAGRDAEVVSTDSRLRLWSEYLPVVDVDDVRLAILAGCDTAHADPFLGDFSSMGMSRGIDSIVTFKQKVYYPSKCTDCVYSGNYFWGRFSAYAKAGDSVATALSRARTDLIGKEGDGGGWGSYRITGSVSSPGTVRLKPAGSGEPLTSRPLGVDPFIVDSLAVHSSRTGTSPMGETTEVETAEGIQYRRLTSTGELIDVVAPASTVGELTLDLDAAERVARHFVGEHARAVSPTSILVQRGLAEHGAGQELAVFHWRASTVDELPGADYLVVEVDRRTGAVTYFAHATDRPSSDDFRLTADQAVDVVSALTSVDGADISVTQDVWDRPRWTVTVDRGLDGLVPDIDRFVIDGDSGEVLSATTA
jgi:hypothetical protein